MARKRGVLRDVDTVVLSDGTKVRTFVGCDEGWLDEYGVKPGDTITFDFVAGTNHAVRFRKATTAASKHAGVAPSTAKAPLKAAKVGKAASPAKVGKAASSVKPVKAGKAISPAKVGKAASPAKPSAKPIENGKTAAPAKQKKTPGAFVRMICDGLDVPLSEEHWVCFRWLFKLAGHTGSPMAFMILGPTTITAGQLSTFAKHLGELKRELGAPIALSGSLYGGKQPIAEAHDLVHRLGLRYTWKAPGRPTWKNGRKVRGNEPPHLLGDIPAMNELVEAFGRVLDHAKTKKQAIEVQRAKG